MELLISSLLFSLCSLWRKIDNRHITINSYTIVCGNAMLYSFKVSNKQMKEETNKQCNVDFVSYYDVMGGWFRYSTQESKCAKHSTY